MAKSTFWDIIEDTLRQVKTPLSAREIWDKANELQVTKNFETTGKTPWATIAAYLYTDLSKNGNDSKFVQTSERPAEFFLRELLPTIDLEKAEEEKEREESKSEKKRKASEKETCTQY